MRFALTIFVFLAMVAVAMADDVGITDVRLIEEGKHVYALEADVSPYLLNTIQRPVLPERCTFLDEEERVRVGPMLVVRYRFTSGDAPLDGDDELLLPWQRTGVVVTAHWLDGASQRAFFDRELAGIRVPIGLLRSVEVSAESLFRSGVADAVVSVRRFGLMHVLLVVACASIGSPRRMAHLLLAFAAGHGLALAATDLGISWIPPSVVAIMTGAAAILMLRDSARGAAEVPRFWPVLITLGLLHGLVYAGPFVGQQVKLVSTDLVIARFAFNSTIDLAHAFLGMATWACIIIGKRVRGARDLRPVVACLGGGLAVALALASVPAAWIPAQPNGRTIGFSASGAPGVSGSTRTVSRPVEVTDPIMGFVTITAFEVRCEWLMRVGDLQPPAAMSELGEAVLPVNAQDAFKDGLMRRLADETVVAVDGRTQEPSAIRANFVTVGTYGVTTRTVPQPEPVDAGVIGVTLAYAVDDAPRAVSVDLRPYPGDVSSIPVAVVDPWGSTPHTLTQDEPRMDWACRMAGFRRPVIRAVSIAPPTWPVVSAGLVVLAAFTMFLHLRGWWPRQGSRIASICCAAAISVYPFIRAPAPTFLSNRAPTKEVTKEALTRLLTNIYRAFDYRTEDAIYDRLEVSATGDQLTAIYLEHRRAMELENRGGARASVDNVDVQEIRGVMHSEGGLRVNASWTVSGSVSHFGHTHYRKNRYLAIVSIVLSEGVWRISGIEVREEERVL